MSEHEKTASELPPQVDDDLENEGFLQRWSRRKRDAGRTPEPVAEVSDETAPVDADAEEPPAEPLLTDEDMPPLETLDQDSDFSPFLSAGVSEALRRKALRKLFLSPKFNVRDGLCEYDHDYTGFTPLGDVITADMRLVGERLKEKARQKAEQWLDAKARELAAEEPKDATAVRGDPSQKSVDGTDSTDHEASSS